MAVGYDGSIRIDSRIDSRGFNTGVRSIGRGLTGITASLKKLAIAAGLAFGTAAIINFGKASVKATTGLTNAMTGLKSILDGQGRSFKDAKNFVNEYVSDGLIPATNAIAAYKNLASRGYTDTQIEQVLVALKDSAAFGRQASYSLGEAVQTATEGLKNENSILVDNAGVTKNVAKMWEDYAVSIGTTSKNLTKQQKIQAEVNGILEETKFQTGDAAKIANSYSGEVLKLGFNFNNLKIAVGNALLPIAWAVLPSINAIISALTRLANVFAQVTTAIFGKQAKQQDQIAKSGVGAAKAQNKLADATKKAGKEAKSAVAGFDDLNVMAENTASSALDSSDELGERLGLEDITPGGEIGTGVTVSSDIEDAINTIKTYLMQIKTYVDEYLKTPFNTAIEMILPKIEEFKATLSDLWEDIGNLGQPLKNWFIDDFTPFLQATIQSVGKVVSGLFDTFNMVFSDVWEIVIYPSIEKFISVGLPLWTDFATRTVDAFTVLFDEVKEIFDMLWREGVRPALSLIIKIWSDAWDSVVDAWNTFGEPIFEEMKRAFKSIGDLFKTIWNTILKPIWDNFMQTVDWLWTKHLKPLLDNFLSLVGEFILGALKIINEFIVPLVKEFVEEFGPPIALVFNTILDVISTAIARSIDIINGIITILKGIIQFLTGVFTGDWRKAWEGIVNIFKGIFQGLEGIVKGILNSVIDMMNFLIGRWNILKFKVPEVDIMGMKFGGFEIGTPTIKNIPKLATGAVIPPNSEFLAILGDQKSGRNLEAPEGLIRQIIREELGGMNVGGQQELTINFAGSMSQLIRVLKPYIDKENSRVGTKLVIGGAP